MADQDQDILLGRLAVHYKMLSKEQAQQAIRLWRSTAAGQGLGEFLVQESYIPAEALPKLHKARDGYLRRSAAKAQPESAPPAPTPPAPAPPAPAATEIGAVGAATVRLTPDMLAAAAQPGLAAPAAADPAMATQMLPPQPGVSELPTPELPSAPELPAPELPSAPGLPDPASAAPSLFAPDSATSDLEAIPVTELPVPEPVSPPGDAELVAPGLFAPEPVEPVPIEAVPVEAVPVEAVPVEAVPVEAVPVEPQPIELQATPEEDALSLEVVEVDAAEPVPAQAEAEGTLRYKPGDTLEDLLRRACETGASDMHVHSGAPLKIRINGELEDASGIVDRDAAQELVFGVLTDEQRAVLEEHQQLDFSFAIEGVARFRANSYFQHRGLDAVFRIIPPEPPTLEELGLPGDLSRFAEFHQGIVLFTGPAGCGKSSTMAALVRMINESRPDHILTIEDPIEYVHMPDRCVVNQREVGPHTESFARALRAALREDPDIIVIGEMRDLETISQALTAAETGHLVLGTLHTASTIPTLNRLVGVFPPDQQAQIRTMVSESLRGIVSQRLVPRADGEGRVPALEILINNRAIGNLVRENRTFQVKSILQTGGKEGMCELDVSLGNLVKEGIITKEMAKKEALDPKRFA